MAEKPAAAFAISLAAGIIILINGLLLAVAAAALGGIALAIIPIVGMIAIAFAFIGLIFGILVIVGSAIMYTTKPSRVKAGSILVLIFSILSILIGGGFLIGLILGIIGGVLGLVWKPPAKSS